MPNEYDQITAFHYAAYRPPLHLPILTAGLPSTSFDTGLDIGCGTGQSAIALTNFCQQVVGIEPSIDMLNQALPHARIQYQFYDGRTLNFPNQQFNLTTFAGSLYYAKSQRLLDEVIRVSQQDSWIFIYDFKIVLVEVVQLLGVPASQPSAISYDHLTNFDGLQQPHLTLRTKNVQSSALYISIENIVHLLLSSKDNYTLLSAHFQSTDLYTSIVKQLLSLFPLRQLPISIQTYSTLYHIQKS
jgi:ubiquinone/menaquinone biosynthesis C-methylase UbiE